MQRVKRILLVAIPYPQNRARNTKRENHRNCGRYNQPGKPAACRSNVRLCIARRDLLDSSFLVARWRSCLLLRDACIGSNRQCWLGLGARAEERLVGAEGNRNHRGFALAFSRKIRLELFAQMGHLHANDIVIQWIEIAASAQSPIRNVKFVNGLLGLKNRLPNDKEEHVAQLRGPKERGAAGHSLSKLPARVAFEKVRFLLDAHSDLALRSQRDCPHEWTDYL